ncbi:MAG: ribonuclease E/G [Lachnospiraceae bacterium]|nr:ribonuclease E/G [Lachnospiraceae bacterium]
MRLLKDKLLLTKYDGCILSARRSGNEIIELSFEPEKEQTIVGNVYVARVENVVKNIGAVFVSYDKGEIAYLPLEEATFGKLNKDNTPVHQGELLLIEIASEAIKTKPPKATTYINCTGRYSVLTMGKPGLGISSKIIDANLRNLYKDEFTKYLTDEYGIIIRTSAESVSFEEIRKEIEQLIKDYESIIKYADTRSAHTILRKDEKSYLKALRNIDFNEISQIVTDDTLIYKDVLEYIERYDSSMKDKLVLMNEETDSVLKIYGLESKIKQALSSTVWLKCGGYLVIQPTEALTVIDVNSGKCISKKKSIKDTVRKVNFEACEMIAKQLRLRNLSGIIIVDFIDMDDEDMRKELLDELKKCIEPDPVKTVVVDITKLNLVEITRKKIRKPIYEQRLQKG